MRVPFGKPIIEKEEMDAVAKVLQGPILVHGPVAEEFESSFAAFTRAPYAVSVASCTAGMHLVYHALGLGHGDEVIVPAHTHVATAHAVELTGAKAVFIDAELDTGNADLDSIEAAICKQTKAIAVVHYLGVPVDMIRVNQIAKRYDLFVLEDCALAPGTLLDGVHAGLHGDVGVFSFYPVKHLTTAEGGMVITKHADLAAKIRHLRAFGVDRNHSERKVPGMYDASALGFNYRMSEIHAAIGVEQMRKLPGFLERRRNNFERLQSEIADLGGCRVLPQPNEGRFTSSCYCLGLVLDEAAAARRSEIMERLTEVGVGTSIYYPQPVPRMSYYKNKYGYKPSDYGNAAIISDRIIALPVGPHLKEEDMFFVSQQLKKVWKELNV
jgi:dTDP-4-amino-4,6-dideoxygalactose transaminase